MHHTRLPVLHPCDQDWSRMSGTRERRHCAACDRDVLDLSAMRAAAAIDALIARGGQACVRYRIDADGEIEFAPPPPRRPGPVAAAALALTACAGWAEDPATVAPDELGMCIPDPADPDAADCPAFPEAPDHPRRPSAERPDPLPSDPDPDPAAGDDASPGASHPDPDAPSSALVDPLPIITKIRPVPLHHRFERMGFVAVVERASIDPTISLFARPSTAGPGRDWPTLLELWRMKRQLRREERLRLREARLLRR